MTPDLFPVRAAPRPTPPDPTARWRERLDLRRLVGRSPVLAAVFERVDLVAAREVTVLLTGESGTGKSCLARVIHDNSHRRDGPFVALNCATVSEELLVSELFGARRGSHSTAHADRLGKVEAAAGGTLFLDEVSELTPRAQAGLLQLLEEGVFYPLGATTPRRADVRAIAATNARLEEQIARGAFREDLYYRLDQLRIEAPPLRARREDVPLLAAALARELAGELRVAPRLPSPAVALRLEARDWPGNVRGLRRVLRQALLRAERDGAAAIELRHLDAEPAPSAPAPLSLDAATRRFRRALLEDALDACGWNVARAAARLEVSRQRVYQLMRDLELRPEPSLPA